MVVHRRLIRPRLYHLIQFLAVQSEVFRSAPVSIGADKKTLPGEMYAEVRTGDHMPFYRVCGRTWKKLCAALVQCRDVKLWR